MFLKNLYKQINKVYSNQKEIYKSIEILNSMFLPNNNLTE